MNGLAGLQGDGGAVAHDQTRVADIAHPDERFVADALDAVVGVPAAGEVVDGETFDGVAEAAIFPGDLPADPKAALRGEGLYGSAKEADYRFVRFRPPLTTLGPQGVAEPLPHIRLDRALQFLLGDRLA